MNLMKKIINNKLLMMPLVLVLTASIAMFAFAPASTQGKDPNKGLFFRAVKYCIPEVIQRALQWVFKGLLSLALGWIPIVGEMVIALPPQLIPIPCGCDNNLYDSALTPFNVKDNPFDFLGDGFTIPVINYKLTQSTQKKLEEYFKKLSPQWTEAQNQQAAMVKNVSVQGVDVFMDAYKRMRQGLINANSLAYIDNFEDEFKRRFPNMSASVTKMSDAEKNAALAWRTILDAWMKALGIAGRNFEEEQRIRNTLAQSVLKTYAQTVNNLGQEEMLQYLGAMAAQANATTDRMNAEWLGFMGNCVECMAVELQLEETAERNVRAIAEQAAGTMPSTKTYNAGF